MPMRFKIDGRETVMLDLRGLNPYEAEDIRASVETEMGEAQHKRWAAWWKKWGDADNPSKTVGECPRVRLEVFIDDYPHQPEHVQSNARGLTLKSNPWEVDEDYFIPVRPSRATRPAIAQTTSLLYHVTACPSPRAKKPWASLHRQYSNSRRIDRDVWQEAVKGSLARFECETTKEAMVRRGEVCPECRLASAGGKMHIVCAVGVVATSRKLAVTCVAIAMLGVASGAHVLVLVGALLAGVASLIAQRLKNPKLKKTPP